MPLPASPLALAAASPVDYSGSWSPLTLTIAIIMVFISLILLVVLLIYSLDGRFSAQLPEEEPPPTGPLADEFRAELEAYRQQNGNPQTSPAESTQAEETAPAEAIPASSEKSNSSSAEASEAAPPPKKRRPQTGLWQLICAAGASIPAVMVFSWVDNSYGIMRSFTWGTALNLVLLAAQIYLIIKFIRIQKKRTRQENVARNSR